ncbi:alpha/beta hydrolase family protein [Stackebrandtia nassauensis]|uniref:Peptidase S9 prolyl oligopeptidase catalytic domain-containing protein n=1 Tax=Stackebrandtia nassauensis (strain DSM 44728 / CIP 108903 / NRRL B-16338 / NBRC 102104 / LLR-40K-21) TaxID=446470 RepID=D3Q486_STANL|nr:alpha/beta fold hydrolase [Stackebrandtia nassauensis]ADD45971.1 hypothetical protein Snas_6355 [Stackebrandtia nassauensis DSM 44728]
MVKPVEDVVPDVAPAAAAPKRRRWLRYAAATLAVILLATPGVSWYFAGEVINVQHNPPEFSLPVTDVTDTEVTLPTEEETVRPGTWGLQWADGRAVLGEVVRSNAETVTREIDDIVYGELREGTATRIDGWTYGEDPKQAHGIDFDEVDVPTELGDAPASPDGYHHLGDSEWRDVEAAIDYALDKGAKNVVLHGWSMGGAVTMTTLRRMEAPDRVAGIILDSPVLDWNSTLDKQGGQRFLPAPITGLAKSFAEWRAGFDLADLDQRAFAPDLETPTLLFADTADETVEVSATLDFAAAAPEDLLTLVKTSSGHTSSWNEDPGAYSSQLEKFLANLSS